MTKPKAGGLAKRRMKTWMKLNAISRLARARRERVRREGMKKAGRAS